MSEQYDWRAAGGRGPAAWGRLGQFRAGGGGGRPREWERRDQCRGGRRADRPRKYVVDMFAYPSGDLHMGHAEAYAIGDAIARYWIQRGYDVLHPIGWDSFCPSADKG